MKKKIIFTAILIPLIYSLIKLFWLCFLYKYFEYTTFKFLYNFFSVYNTASYIFENIIPIIITISLMITFIILSLFIKKENYFFVKLAMLIPLIMAPFSILGHWSIWESNSGITFFLKWLTKYPNFGPINYEVLLGIICIVMCSVIPVVFAFYFLRVKKCKSVNLIIIILLDLLFYIPVIIRLDFISLGFAIIYLKEGLYYFFPVLLFRFLLVPATIVLFFVNKYEWKQD